MTAAKIRQTALAYLARRDHTQQEIQQKLLAKSYLLADIQAVLTDLIAENLLDDERFAEHYIHYRKTKGYGPLRIREELKTRGISEDIIAEVLQIADNAWFTEIHKLWQKTFKGKAPQDFKSRAKQMRFLYYRGFTQEHIQSLFRVHDEE